MNVIFLRSFVFSPFNLMQRPQVFMPNILSLVSKYRQFLQIASILSAATKSFVLGKSSWGKENPLSLLHFQQICLCGSFCLDYVFYTVKGAEGQEGHPSAPQPISRRNTPVKKILLY